jgi:transposase
MHDEVLGVDISKRKFDVALVESDKFRSKVFNNCLQGYAQLHAWLKGRSVKPHICMEATGRYGHGLATYLRENGFLVSMVNPARIKGFAQSELSRTKTDKADAKLIARFCLAMKPSEWVPEPTWQLELRQWVAHLDSLKAMLRAEENRLESIVCESVEIAIKELNDELKRKILEAEKRFKRSSKMNRICVRNKDCFLLFLGLVTQPSRICSPLLISSALVLPKS